MKRFPKKLFPLLITLFVLSCTLVTTFTLPVLNNTLALHALAASCSGSCGEKLAWSFDKSSGILTISGEGNMKNFKNVDNPAPWQVYCLSIKTVKIENSVTSVGDDAFRQCENLTLVTIPDSVTSIGDFSFMGCKNLSDMKIPDSVEYVGKEAFTDTAYYDDSSNWENGVLYTGKHLYKAKETLKGDYEINAGTLSIGNDAFCQCENLNSVTIPDSVKKIGDGAFYSCDSLAKVKMTDSVVSIGDYAFMHCGHLSDIKLSANTTNIGNELFEDCHSLTDIVIPNSVRSIGSSAFRGCNNLTSIAVPDSVTSIGYQAFYGCENLADITLPDSLTKIGTEVFTATAYYFNPSNWENDVLYIGKHLIAAREKISGDYEIKQGTLTLAGEAFFCCRELTGIKIPDSVKGIGSQVFFSCIKLKEINIPDSVTYIDESSFYNTAYYNDSSNWENDSLYIGNHLIKVNENTVGEYEIKEGTLTVAGSALHKCKRIEKITVPESVRSIGNYGLYGCNNLKDIYFSGTGEQWKNVSIGMANDIFKSANVHFAKGTTELTSENKTESTSDVPADSAENQSDNKNDVNSEGKVLKFKWQYLVILAAVIVLAAAVVLMIKKKKRSV